MSLSRRVVSPLLTAGWLGAAGLLALDLRQGVTEVVPAPAFPAALEPPAGAAPPAPDPAPLTLHVERGRRVPVAADEDFARLNTEFDGVHVFPVYETDRIVGLEFGLIQYGTRFAEIGLETGDVIIELDGRPVDSAAMSAQVLAAISEADAFHAVGRAADGSAREWRDPK